LLKDIFKPWIDFLRFCGENFNSIIRCSLYLLVDVP